DPYKSVGIDLADVAREQPAVDPRGLGGGRVLEVTQKHAGASHQDLAVRGELDLRARRDPPRGAQAPAPRARAAERRDARALGLAVDLPDGDPARQKELEHLAPGGGRTGDRDPEPVEPELRPELGEKEPVGRAVL